MSERGDFVLRYVVPGANALCLGFGVTRLVGAFLIASTGATGLAIVTFASAMLAFAVVAILARWRHARLVNDSAPSTSDERVSAWITATLGHDWSLASPFPPPRRRGRFASAQRIVLASGFALLWACLCTSALLALEAASKSGWDGLARLPFTMLGLCFWLSYAGGALVLAERVLAWIGKGFGEPVDRPSARYAELRRRHGHG